MGNQMSSENQISSEEKINGGFITAKDACQITGKVNPDLNWNDICKEQAKKHGWNSIIMKGIFERCAENFHFYTFNPAAILPLDLEFAKLSITERTKYLKSYARQLGEKHGFYIIKDSGINMAFTWGLHKIVYSVSDSEGVREAKDRKTDSILRMNGNGYEWSQKDFELTECKN